jgi:phage tail-like protein
MHGDTPHFRHLNAAGRWPGFAWQGLERESDGTLRLVSLPRIEGPPPEDLAALPAPEGPAGLAAGPDGALFWSLASEPCVRMAEACFGAEGCVPIGGAGDDPTLLREPRALLALPARRALLVADAGLGVVQVFDLDSWQWLDSWRGFQAPTGLAADEQGSVYVLDSAAGKIEKVAISGDRVPAFWSALEASGRVARPVGVAAAGLTVFVLDAEHATIEAFDAAGNLLGRVAEGLQAPLGLAAEAGAVYAGDNARRRVCVFTPDAQGAYQPAGDAVGYEGPVAALALDGRGRLWVHTGAARAPVALRLGAGCRGEGWLWSGPLSWDALPHAWQRVRPTLQAPPGAHLQWFLHTASQPPDPPVHPGAAEPFPPPWRALPVDVNDFFAGGGPARHLWLAARFFSDGTASPRLSQLRVELDGDGYPQHLPEIYRTERGCGDFLERFLALFEGLFHDMEDEIEGLAHLLDPQVAPRDSLAWLASFLAVDLPEGLEEARQRALIAGAFERSARRGTLAGLSEALRVEAGVRAVIEEPIQGLAVWSLAGGADSSAPLLGFGTVLASAEAQGAVVGTSAVLDRSHLVTNAEYGAPLFDDVAHRFTVRVYRGEVEGPRALESVRALIEREKPAHTAFELCVIQPGMRVGYSSRLGIDTVVGGPPLPRALGQGALVLDGEAPGRLGERSVVGRTTRL